MESARFSRPGWSHAAGPAGFLGLAPTARGARAPLGAQFPENSDSPLHPGANAPGRSHLRSPAASELSCSCPAAGIGLGAEERCLETLAASLSGFSSS